MTISQLQYIVALDTHRHFVKAAEHCFVAQPTLTIQVKKLEEEIGMSIFDRSHQPLKPTPTGKSFITQARAILREVDKLKSMVNHEREATGGTFKLGIIPSLSTYLLPLFLPVFSKAFPDTTLEIKEWQSDDIISGIKSNELNLGLLVTPLEETQIREIPLFYEPFMIYAHESHSLLAGEYVDADQLSADDLWLLEKGHCFRNQTLNICSQEGGNGVGRNIKFDGGSLETLKSMIQQLSGYTLIPELAYDPDREAGFVKKFASPEPAREVSLVTHRMFTREKLVSELSQAIIRSVPSSFATGGKYRMIKWR